MTTLTELEAIQTVLQIKDEDFNIYDRGEMYLRLYELTNSPATILEGNISTFSGLLGGAAFLGNYMLVDQSQNGRTDVGYPYSMTNEAGQPNEVYEISHLVATDHITETIRVFEELDRTGLTIQEGTTAAAQTWQNRGLPDQFPGQIFGIVAGETINSLPIPVGLWLPGGQDGELAANDNYQEIREAA